MITAGRLGTAYTPLTLRSADSGNLELVRTEVEPAVQ